MFLKSYDFLVGAFYSPFVPSVNMYFVSFSKLSASFNMSTKHVERKTGVDKFM